MKEELLRVENLAVTFEMYQGKLSKRYVQGIKDISLSIYTGEILAVVGASGSGKSLLAHAIMGLLPYNSTVEGKIFYKGEPLTPKQQELYRGSELALVPQSITYLDPTMKVGKQVIGLTGTMAEQETVFAKLALHEGVSRMYPFELSGGMARRVLVSTALISHAQFIVADEPTPGMEMKDAVQALQMFRDMANEGKSCMLITHDLDLAIHVADRVAVFYDGRLIDVTEARNFQSPELLTHPYTRALFNALPQNEFRDYSKAEVEQFLMTKEGYDVRH